MMTQISGIEISILLVTLCFYIMTEPIQKSEKSKVVTFLIILGIFHILFYSSWLITS
jgi:hypothetical protein